MKKRIAQIVVLVLLFGMVLLYGGKQYLEARRSAIPTVVRQSDIPEDGLAMYDTDGKVPGNPQNGIDGLRKVQKLRDIYIRRHNGQIPLSMKDMLWDTVRNFREYGFTNMEGAWDYLDNPDWQYTDDNGHAKRSAKLNTMSYDFSGKRPDGTLITTPKTGPGRDVIATTNIYVHRNVRLFKGARSTENPVGFHLVLWDDNTIEKVPYDKIYFIPGGPPEGSNNHQTWTTAFIGQAGVPKTAITYDQFYLQTGWKKAPHGVPGGKGIAYNGKSYRK